VQIQSTTLAFAVDDAAGEGERSAHDTPGQNALEVPAQYRVADHSHGERAPSDLHHEVGGADDHT